MGRWGPVPDERSLYSLVHILSFSKLVAPIYVAMQFMERLPVNFVDMNIIDVS